MDVLILIVIVIVIENLVGRCTELVDVLILIVIVIVIVIENLVGRCTKLVDVLKHWLQPRLENLSDDYHNDNDASLSTYLL